MSMNKYPRIVSNGKKYRIELSPGNFDLQLPKPGFLSLRSRIWETRFLWRARRNLRDWEVYLQSSEADKPERWQPV